MTRPSPPGWYPDPAGSGRRRYFDGARWGPLEPIPTRQLSINWNSQADSWYSRRSRIVAGLLQLFFGWHGLGRFYLGYYHLGAVQLTLGLVGLATTLLCYVGLIILVPLTIWVEIEAVMMLAGSIRDAEGYKLR
ncbi:NINE protein [Mycobacterium gordonae]|nr:NINE protein [Mycobacterium gordonae]